MFPKSREDMQEAKNQSTKYVEFDEELKSLILEKEEQGLVYWFQPDKDYNKASEFFQKVQDPLTGENYLPLLLDDDWWRSEFVPEEAKFTANVDQIINNYTTGENDYDSVMELIAQSNPTLIPTLFWEETVYVKTN